ncbi:MAG: glycosyltransferase [Fervidobacterium sp.]
MEVFDVAITRAGATTISELIHFNVPALVIPWEGSTESHQIVNAKIIEKEKLGVMIREIDYNREQVVNIIEDLIRKGRNFEERENPACRIVDSICKSLNI